MLDTLLTGAKIGGSLLSQLFGSKGDETPKRIVDPFTERADQENQQQKMLNKQLYQTELAGANRSANQMINTTANQSMGAQAQMGMADNATTNALLGMATGNLGSQVMDQSSAATGRYAGNMGQTNDFTKSLANDTIYRFNQEGPNAMDGVGNTIANLGAMMVDSSGERAAYKKLRAKY